LEILWASRLDIQKRPDILIKVAEKCKTMPYTFHVYGSPVYGTSEREVKNFIGSLKALPNVRLPSTALPLTSSATGVIFVRAILYHAPVHI
jgi:glycosyltransferase involved in cell wall biosynthesis